VLYGWQPRGSRAEKLGYLQLVLFQVDGALNADKFTVIEVHFRSCSPGPLRLRHLAKVLSSEDYSKKYPNYRLLSANCWAWSRGVLFDVIRHPSSVPSEIMTFDRPSSALGRDIVSGPPELSEGGQRVLSKEEVELEILTNYGAYGNVLLHLSSGMHCYSFFFLLVFCFVVNFIAFMLFQKTSGLDILLIRIFFTKSCFDSS